VTASVHFSSKTDLWATPEAFFAAVNEEYHFTLDVCALPENAKCERFFSPDVDGLKQCWTGTCWMNPPYGRDIGEWIKKAYESAKDGATVVCLLPARTDTRWWHDFVTRAEDVYFLRGRLRFGKANSGAPFPSALVIFKPPLSERLGAWRSRQLPLFRDPMA
jgi:phage N-6-adenine-methyltransferase